MVNPYVIHGDKKQGIINWQKVFVDIIAIIERVEDRISSIEASLNDIKTKL